MPPDTSRIRPARRGIAPIVGAALFGLAGLPAHAASLDQVAEAVANGSTQLSLRYRFEHVDQDGFERNANASTARPRLTWTSAPLQRWQAGIEADYLVVLGPERYDSTVNGKTRYPVVADPEAFDLNQAYLTYRTDTLNFTGGRQRILQGRERFVGAVGWRQNEQTFDAVRVALEPRDGVQLDYAWLANVNRVFGPDDGAQPGDWRSDSHVLSVDVALRDDLAVTGFAHLLDFDNDNGPINSNATVGAEARLALGPVNFTAAVARQSDHGDSPLDYVAWYALAEASATVQGVTLGAGWERLGSDGGEAAFRTPLATLHKFQGWADQFLSTPDVGVRDTYLTAQGNYRALRLTAAYHWFDADEGGGDLGRELDLAAAWAATERLGLELKYADYRADGFAADTRKVWLTVNLLL